MHTKDQQKAFWQCSLRVVSTIFSSEKKQAANYNLFVEDSEHLRKLQDLVIKTALMFDFKSTKVQESIFAFVNDQSKSVVVSFQHPSELDFTREWIQLYKPYDSKYGVLTQIKQHSILNKTIASIKPFILDGNEIKEYKQISLHNNQKEIVDWFIVDNEAIPILQKLKSRFILQNGRPFCSKAHQFVVSMLFSKSDEEEFIYLNGLLDLRFRSICVGNFGVKLLKSRKQKEENSELAKPKYKDAMVNYLQLLAAGARTQNADIAATIQSTIQY